MILSSKYKIFIVLQRRKFFLSILLDVLLITAIAGIGGTGLGGCVSALLRKDSKKAVSLLLGFAAGIMLAVVCFDLIESALFPGDATEPVHIFNVIIGIIVGYCTVFLLNYIIDKNTNKEIPHIDKDHPRTADNLDELYHSNHYLKHEEEKSNLFIAGIIMACAIALHNLPEGMVIGASYATQVGASIFSGSGIIIAIVIGLHNIPEGMAVAVPLISGGMSKKKAVIITAFSGAPTVIGAFIGYTLGTLGDLWLSLSLSFASGAMLYVVFAELIPEAILTYRSKLPSVSILVGLLFGIILVYC